MIKVITSSLLMMSSLAFAAPKTVFITTDSDVQTSMNKSFSKGVDFVKKNNEGISVFEIEVNKVEEISHLMHEDHHRCGGFVVHESKAEALAVLNSQKKINKAQKGLFNLYTIDQQETVENMLKEVNEFEIRGTIQKLSSYHNRYYKAQTGVESSNWIKDNWTEIASSRSDIKVELYKHRSWPQPSVIATVEGTESPDEIIVIGGHADSIAGFFGGARNKAPGADDNASGVSTFTEVLRVLVASDFRPKKTVKFMAYAAEEVGLLGSKEIAADFKANNQNVVGVLQLDMTNFDGSDDMDIVLIGDYTNKEQNEFLGKLIDTYVKVPWGYSKCGYACSDHASWTNNGYPASIPFEAKKEDMNGKIHTANDLLRNMRGDALHAEKFAKLAVAYMVELSK